MSAVAVVNAANHSVDVTCLIGHRFADGDSYKVLHCRSDGSWDDVGNCGSTCEYFILYHCLTCIIVLDFTGIGL